MEEQMPEDIWISLDFYEKGLKRIMSHLGGRVPEATSSGGIVERGEDLLEELRALGYMQ